MNLRMKILIVPFAPNDLTKNMKIKNNIHLKISYIKT